MDSTMAKALVRIYAKKKTHTKTPEKNEKE